LLGFYRDNDDKKHDNHALLERSHFKEYSNDQQGFMIWRRTYYTKKKGQAYQSGNYLSP